jgi:hypothetical protein
VRALGLFILLPFLATPAAAQSRDVLGYAGVLGEWELTATVTATGAWWGKQFSGPLTLKHVGLCTQEGPEEKAGEIHLQVSPFSSRLRATLSVAGEACTLNADLSDAYKGVMTCAGGRAVPLTLWLK